MPSVKDIICVLSIVSVVIFASSVDAKTHKDWIVTYSVETIKAMSWAVDGSPVAAVMYKDVGGDTNVGFVGEEGKCTGFGEPFNVRPHSVNGQMVRFSKQCVSDNMALFYATSVVGGEFIREAFFKNRIVSVDGIKFSALGFSAAYNQIQNDFLAI